jgi:hypothetical protein
MYSPYDQSNLIFLTGFWTGGFLRIAQPPTAVRNLKRTGTAYGESKILWQNGDCTPQNTALWPKLYFPERIYISHCIFYISHHFRRKPHDGTSLTYSPTVKSCCFVNNSVLRRQGGFIVGKKFTSRIYFSHHTVNIFACNPLPVLG